MAGSKIVFYKGEDDCAPVFDWMLELKDSDEKAYLNGLGRLTLLEEQGHELRRPAADFLEDGIYELRWKHERVQYRILYFFNGQESIVLAHSIVKKGKEVPAKDIKRAAKRKKNFESDPKAFTYEAKLPDVEEEEEEAKPEEEIKEDANPEDDGRDQDPEASTPA